MARAGTAGIAIGSDSEKSPEVELHPWQDVLEFFVQAPTAGTVKRLLGGLDGQT